HDIRLSAHVRRLKALFLVPATPTRSSAIVAVDFDAGGCNVLESATVTGKKKKGALQLHPTTILCNVKTRGGKEYKVHIG
ncbi:unnamed protein product, partial [Ectocarpus sp. 12 AP-2014]